MPLVECEFMEKGEKTCYEKIVIFSCANDTEIIDHLLIDRALYYNKHKLPSPQVDVRIEMWVQEVTSVSELTQDFEIGTHLLFYFLIGNLVANTLAFRFIHERILDRPRVSLRHSQSLSGNLSLKKQKDFYISGVQGNLSFDWAVMQNIWTPNTCFINSKKAQLHSSPFTNVFLMVFPNGEFYFPS